MRRIVTAPHDGASNNLEGCSLLAGLSLQDLQRNCPAATIHTFRHGSTIYTQGERCSNLFCVLSGQVKLARVSDEGNEFTTGFLTTGELFGPALSGSDSLEAQETATTKGTVSVWRVPAKEFRNLLLQHPALSLRVVEALARRQRQM